MFQLSDRVSRFIPEWRDLKVRERAADGTERLVEPREPDDGARPAHAHVRPRLRRRADAGSSCSRPTTPSRAEALTPGSRRGPDATLASHGRALRAVTRWSSIPGTHWLYTVSTDICGRLVEIMSGQRFDDYLRETIFEPLGMTDTGF